MPIFQSLLPVYTWRTLFIRSAYWLRLAAGLLILSILLGLATTQADPEVIVYAVAALGPIAEILSQMSWWQIIVIIFLNNALTILLAVFGGILLGILPIIFLIFNGYMVGIMAWSVAAEHGPVAVLAALLPHGLWEAAAFVLAAGWGMYLGQLAWQGFWHQHRSDFITELKTIGRLVVILILPMLAVAAVIEVLLTPVILTGLCPECLPID